jgi:5-methylcytosine-specific restriction endonuclease McrA
MIKITKYHIAQLKTLGGGYSRALVDYAKEITVSDKFIKALDGFTATPEQWENMLRLSGATKREAFEKRREKKRNKIINATSMPDGWSWKPTEIPLVKCESKNNKNRGKKARRREYISQLGAEFYSSPDWLALRVRVLERYECKCMMCGRSPKAHRVVIHVDHIKPRSKFPELSLDFDNLQLLCEDCNLGKRNKYHTDYRPDAVTMDFD